MKTVKGAHEDECTQCGCVLPKLEGIFISVAVSCMMPFGLAFILFH